MAEKLILEVDTGAVDVDVVDNGDVLGTFRFNPSDSNIIDRYESVAQWFDGVEPKTDGTEEEQIAWYSAFAKDIERQFDYLLGYPVSESIFGKCGALSITKSGDYYYEVVINGLTKLIENVIGERVKRKMKRVKAATSKYHK